eukprot:1448386-Amphidinium_carterae.1
MLTPVNSTKPKTKTLALTDCLALGNTAVPAQGGKMHMTLAMGGVQAGPRGRQDKTRQDKTAINAIDENIITFAL